jgi:ABC-2 type transport system permease protein
VRTYLLLAAAEFRRFSTYRLAILAGVFTQSVFGFIRVSVLFAAVSAAAGTDSDHWLDRDCRAGQQR